MTCPFCPLAAGGGPDLLFENDHAVAVADINPVAPTHVLIIAKRHVTGISGASDADGALLGELLLAARTVAEQLGMKDRGYRLVINDGGAAGQSVFHLHVHLIGGRLMSWPPG